MRRISKILGAFILGICLCAVPVSAQIATYYFEFPDYTGSVGSMHWSDSSTSTGITPYVYPDYTYLNTFYFLTNNYGSTYQVSNIVNISTRSKKYFTYKSGYGGTGHVYRLAGYPDSSIPYRPGYQCEGTWAD